MIYNCSRMRRNVFCTLHHTFDVRHAFPLELTHYYLTLTWICPTLIHPNEWNLTVRRLGSSNHLIFMMLWVDSNQHLNHSTTELLGPWLSYYRGDIPLGMATFFSMERTTPPYTTYIFLIWWNSIGL